MTEGDNVVVGTVVRTERRWEFDHTAAAVPAAREQLVEFLTSLDVPDSTVMEAELVASELLGNAVTHGREDSQGHISIQVRVRVHVVEVAVTDGGPADGQVPDVRPRRTSVIATRGRGLRIVRALAHEWGVVVEDGDGTTVWAAIGGPSRRRVV